jgi:hypothetical protein
LRLELKGSGKIKKRATSASGQGRPFALVEPPASFTSPAYFAAEVVALGPTDGASYDIPNFPVYELAHWLAARSKGAYFNLNANTDRPWEARRRDCRNRDAPPPVDFFIFKKSGIGADAIRAAGSQRRLR